MRTTASKSIAAKDNAPELRESARGSFYALVELTKPRLSMMAIFSAMLGFLAFQPSPTDYATFFFLLLGTALAAGGAAALNQWMEREEDKHMKRTSDRPLPAGIIEPQMALVFGMILSIGALVCLSLKVNAWATGLTAITLVTYLVIYTPLKKRTPLATEVGAVSGALPPLMGWVAATNEPSAFGWLLFGILFAWQMPHFMAISWTYRDEYSKAGFKMLSHEENGAKKVARKSMIYSVILGALAISPVYYDYGAGLSGTPYLCVAIILSLALFFSALRFVQAKDKTTAARSLFFVTIVQLPLLLAALVIDRYL